MSAPLTGRKVFVITAAAFTVIIGVNVVMAYMAVSTFPGLETKNSYVASQKFDADRAAQLALNWTARATIEDGTLVLELTDQTGAPVTPQSVEATLGRPTHLGEDVTPAFVFSNGVYTAPVSVAPGNWNLRLLAIAEDGTQFRQRIVIYLRDGA